MPGTTLYSVVGKGSVSAASAQCQRSFSATPAQDVGGAWTTTVTVAGIDWVFGVLFEEFGSYILYRTYSIDRVQFQQG